MQTLNARLDLIDQALLLLLEGMGSSGRDPNDPFPADMPMSS
jgi:hypothetical protein